MEFIKRSGEPQLLLDNKVKWTQPWINFYHEKKDQNGELIRNKKPTDNHWLKDDIRQVLISDFKNNCGYCGCSRPTPRAADENRTCPRGHVDHYLAKATHPQLTYKWDNYIWSCEACNVEKGEFDNPQDQILNPCCEEDCKQLEFITDTGKYCLSNEDIDYYERFIHTDQSTMLNSTEIVVRRRNRVKTLKCHFNIISLLLNNIENNDFKLVIKDSITNILNDLEDHEFYYLMQKKFMALRSQHPKIAQLIDETIG
jgi:hypothetical protein